MSEQVCQCGTESKKLYKLINNIIYPLPDSNSPEVLVEEFAEYFITKIQKILDALEDKPLYEPTADAGSMFKYFEVLSTEEIIKLYTLCQQNHVSLILYQPNYLRNCFHP